MTRRKAKRADVNASEEEEIISLIRGSYKRRYSHSMDVDTAYAEFHSSISEHAGHEQSLPRRARDAFSAAWQRISRGWLASLPHWAVVIAGAAAILIIAILVAGAEPDVPLAPRTHDVAKAPAGQVFRNMPPDRPSAGLVSLTAEKARQRNVLPDTRAAYSPVTQQPSSQHPARDETSANLLAVDVALSGKRGTISLNVTLRNLNNVARAQLQAILRVVVNPTLAAQCSVTLLHSSSLTTSVLFSEMKTPSLVKILFGPSDSFTVQLSPTGLLSRPLSCSVVKTGEQSRIPAVTAQPSSLLGTAGAILRSVGTTSSISAALNVSSP
jgi:hypothetical protein